jgi:hypothetical protein
VYLSSSNRTFSQRRKLLEESASDPQSVTKPTIDYQMSFVRARLRHCHPLARIAGDVEECSVCGSRTSGHLTVPPPWRNSMDVPYINSGTITAVNQITKKLFFPV